MPNLAVNIRCSTGEKHAVTLESSLTIFQVKETLVNVVSVPVGQQRLIYKGQVLKDDQTLSDYAVEEGHTIHFVKGAPPRSAAPPASTSTTPPMTTPLSGSGSSDNFQSMQHQMMQNPELMSNMMNSPLMQSMLSNPDLIRNSLMNNPQMRQVLESNPQLNHVLNDPELLRQSMEAARNPEAMREMMRTQDAAMRNVESHPEGFNALRRMYQDVQEPLMNATAGGLGGRPSGPAMPMPGNVTNSTGAAATNPWAGPSVSTATQPTVTTSSAPVNPWGTSETPNSMDINGMSQMMSQMMQMNPELQSQMEMMLSNPNFISQMEQSNPQLQAMLAANPQARSMLGNPDMLRAMMNPQNLQALLQMQQAMNPTFGGASHGNVNDFSNLLGTLNTNSSPTPNMTNPAQLYASQITQLNEMGFTNQDQNTRALQQTMGNVNAAVERILGGQV